MSLNNFVISGYPRSGNNFIVYAIAALTNTELKGTNHTIHAIKNSELSFVPIRHPKDCIASWNNFRGAEIKDLLEDIDYYLRFYQKALEFTHVTFLDFNKFIKDVSYIAKTINLPNTKNINVDYVKKIMIKNGREKNLPQNNSYELDIIKSALDKNEKFIECVVLYEFYQNKFA